MAINPQRARNQNGISLLETLISTALLALVTSGLLAGFNFSHQRTTLAQERAAVAFKLEEQMVLLRASARSSQLAVQNSSTTISGIPGLRPNLTLQTIITPSTQPDALQTFDIRLVASWSSQSGLPGTQTTEIRSSLFNGGDPRYISLKFGPAPTANLSPGAHYGYVTAPNWNNISTGSVSAPLLVDSDGLQTPLQFTNANGTFASNGTLLTTAEPTNFAKVFTGFAIGNSQDYTLNLSGVPYPLYDLIFYYGVGPSGSSPSGTIKVNGGYRVSVLSLSGGDSARGAYVEGRNVGRLYGLSSANLTIIVEGGSGSAIALSGLQIVERL